MGPKRMPKVSSLPSSSSGGAASSSTRGRNANPFGPVDPNRYHDYDESMQDGVELEEKGERFQFGSKAQRFYVQAGTLYDRAAHLAGANVERRADALFNASRIHFLLASQFALPPENLDLLVQAVNTAQEATRLAPPVPVAESPEGALPNPFTLDTMTQLATSLQTLAEAIEELGWPQGLRPPTVYTQFSGQMPTPTVLWQDALALFQQVADGQNMILQDLTVSDSTAPDSVASSSAQATNAEADDSDSDLVSANEGGKDVYGYTSSLVTPSSLMDTLLSVLTILTSLIEAAPTIDAVQTCCSSAEKVIASAQRITTQAEPEAASIPTSHDTSHTTSERTAKWEEIQRASLSVRVASLIKAINLGVEASQISAELEETMQNVNDWASRLISPPATSEPNRAHNGASVATLCDVGEAGQNLCRLSLRLEPAEAGVAAIWALATVSSKLFSQALAALDTSGGGGGSAAVLGQANTSTPTSRARCRILLALSSLSISRSHPSFEAAGIPGAIGTRTKLIDNARLYARKAVTEIGLSWMLRPAPTRAPTSVVVPPPGGWESLSLEAEATFHLLRALLVRAGTSASNAAEPKAISEMEAELSNLVQHISQLGQRSIQLGSTPASASIQLAERLYVQGVRSFVDGVVDDNGRNIVREEFVWWEELLSHQLAVAR